jgi:hypothetical protein
MYNTLKQTTERFDMVELFLNISASSVILTIASSLLLWVFSGNSNKYIENSLDIMFIACIFVLVLSLASAGIAFIWS